MKTAEAGLGQGQTSLSKLAFQAIPQAGIPGTPTCSLLTASVPGWEVGTHGPEE